MNFPPPTAKQARVLWFALTSLAVAIVLVLTGVLLWCLWWVMHRLSSVLVPMAVALILAYILNPVVEFFQSKKIPRFWSVCLVFALGFLIGAAVLGSVLPGLKHECQKLIKELPANVELARVKLGRFLDENPIAHQLPESWQHTLRQLNSGEPPPANGSAGNYQIATNTTPHAGDTNSQTTAVLPNDLPLASSGEDSIAALNEPLSNTVMQAFTHTLVVSAKWFATKLSQVTTWAEFLIGFVLVPVYLFYFLLEKEGITRRWPDYLPMKESAVKDETVFVLRSINECMIVFFRGQVLVALCVGVLLAVGYSIMGLNYAVLLGVVAGVLGVVPYLGTIVSLLLALGVAGVQFGDWTHPLCVLGIAAAVKLLEDFVISPKIIGERAGLHPLTIILAVMVGTTLLGGFLGAMLAIPLTAALRTLMFRYIWTRDHPGEKPPTAEELEKEAS